MPSTLTVYRVEHVETRDGPFWEGRIDWDNPALQMPAPNHYGQERVMNFLTENGRYTFFGFETIDEIFQWFDGGTLHFLQRKGFHIVVYSVPDTDKHRCQSLTQVAFLRAEATVIRKQPLAFKRNATPIDSGGSSE